MGLAEYEFSEVQEGFREVCANFETVYKSPQADMGYDIVRNLPY